MIRLHYRYLRRYYFRFLPIAFLLCLSIAAFAAGFLLGTPYTDWVSQSSFGQGFYTGCIEAGLPEPTCYDRAYAVQPPAWLEGISDWPGLGWLVR